MNKRRDRQTEGHHRINPASGSLQSHPCYEFCNGFTDTIAIFQKIPKNLLDVSAMTAAPGSDYR